MELEKFINTNNKDHVEALEYLRNNGHWPIGFLPDNIVPSDITEQIVLVTFLMANEYVDRLLKEKK